MTRRWIRLDAEWEESEWIDRLTGQAAGCWPRLLSWVKLRGKRGRCRAPSSSVLARRWKVPTQAVDELLEAAIEDGAVRLDGGDLVITNWATYNPDDPTAAARKRKQRAREQEGHDVTEGHDMSRRDTVTRPPTGTVDVGTAPGAIAPEGEPSAGDVERLGPREPTFGEVMAVVRAELHLGRSDGETDRSGNVLKRDFAGRVPPQDVIDACRGTRKLIEEGLVDGVKPGETVGLRFLREWHHAGRLLWDAAIDRERYGGPPTPLSIARRPRAQPRRLEVTP